MSIFLKPGQMKVKDENGDYTGINVIAQESAAEQVEQIEEKGEEVLESIPADYSELSDAVDELNERLGDAEANIGDLSDLDTQDKSSLVAAINEAAQSGGSVDPSVIAEAVDDWLDEHPEATTTVEDGSITYPKLADNVKNYITPEMFGAKGDGTTDDTTALQNCIDAAKSQNKPVRGFNRYKTTSPINISGNYQDILIERLSYTGNDCGITLTGNYNTLKLAQLYCSGGKGLVMKNVSSSGSCSWNRITITRLFATGHAVDFDNSNQYYILYNTFDIRFIKSDTGNCYNAKAHVGENVFMNSSCSCPSGWALYRGGGRYYNFTLEADVLNGICGANGYFSGFRYRELVDKVIYRINGSVPDAQGGTLIKFENWGGHLLFVSDDPVPYAAIDVSDMYTTEDATESPGYAAPGLAYFNVIDAPIRYGNWNTQNGYIVTGRKMIVTGGRKICIPAYETSYEITDADYDMCDAQVALDDAKIYPTKMIIGVDNCVIHLPASYCSYGYSEFIVDQTQGHLCTIYDYNSDVTPIFDGVTLGGGVYRLKAYCNPGENVLSGFDYNQALNDSSNYTWEITRIDMNGGIVCVDDFGAVGDGETDDSSAVQTAVNSGYDIYFSSNKTYYLADEIEVTGDRYLHGGENTVIKTKTPTVGYVNNGIHAFGTKRFDTTFTTDYHSEGTGDNASNKLTLSNMTGIQIGDILVIKATDQFYALTRQYFYLGATLEVTDIYDGHIYVGTSMPWDIENTANVTVSVYAAPQVRVENLNFRSDLDSFGTYNACMMFEYCRNPQFVNCTISSMVMGAYISYCVNALVENVQVSKSKYVNTIQGDGYGIEIVSSTNTVVRRVIALCAQSCLGMTGDIPNIDTYISHCELASEARPNAIGLHDNTYTITVEDCVLGGLDLYGIATVNRCRFINNNRVANSGHAISYKGRQDAKWSRLLVTNCDFGEMGVYLYSPGYQTGITPMNHIIGNVKIKNCYRGALNINPPVNEVILSNTIDEISLVDWEDCKEIYHPSGYATVKSLRIERCNFTAPYFINDHNEAHGLMLDELDYLDLRDYNPLTHKISVSRETLGEKLLLPQNVQVDVSSDNVSAKFIVCGSNLVSDDANDYAVGSVSGAEGADLVRTPATSSSAPSISIDTNGDLVYTQKGNTSSYCVYPVGMFYVQEISHISMSATLVNTGGTSGSTFRPMIAIVDCATGKIEYRGWGTGGTADVTGVNISHSRNVKANKVAMCYFYCNSAVSNAETTIKNIKMSCTPFFAPAVSDEPYTANRRTGDGTILSVQGINNIMCSETKFTVKLQADLID